MRIASICIGALVLGIGCSTDEAKPRDVALSIKVGGSLPAGVSRLALTLPDGIELDRVRFILREVELENENEDEGLDDNGEDNTDDGTDEGPDDNGDDNSDGSSDEDEQEIEFGPILVDLDRAALAGDIVEHIVSTLVPQGTYDELKFKIGPVGARAGDSPELAELTQNGWSVLLEGTIDGEAFVLSSSIEAEQELDVDIVVGDSGSQENLTLFLVADSWFMDAATGERLDPRDPADALSIAGNIRRSIHAEDDDDADGIGDEDDEDDDRSGSNEGHEGEDENDDDDDDGGVDDEDDGGNSGHGG